MKKLRSVLVLLLVFSLVISLAGCGKKAIDADKFDDILYDIGFEVSTDSRTESDRNVREALTAYDYDAGIYASYILYRNADAAKDVFDEVVEDYIYAEEDGDFDGTIKESGRGNFQKVVIEGEMEEYGYSTRMYLVMIYVDDITIFIGTDSVRTRDKEAVDDVVKALGY